MSDNLTNETWFYKPLDMLACNLAVISDDEPCLIRFVDLAGHVFDRITFSENTSRTNALLRNGFKQATENDDFSRLVGLPSQIFDNGGQTMRVYSSGEYWRD